MSLIKLAVLFFSISMAALVASAAPYCDGAWEDHSDKRCRRIRPVLSQNAEINAALGEGLATLSRRISENHVVSENSNFIAFIHASKACYDTNEAGEFTADLAGSKKCAGIRSSNLSRSLAIYAQMEKTTINALSLQAEHDPASLNVLINYLKLQNQDNLDRATEIWINIYLDVRKSGLRRKIKTSRS